MQVTLAALARLLEGEVIGDAQTRVQGIAPLEQAREGDLTVVVARQYVAQLAGSRATAVLIDRHLPVDRPAIRVADPRRGFIALLEYFAPTLQPSYTVDARAVLAPDVELGPQVSIGPYVVIDQGCRLAERVVVYPGTYIGAGCEIGAGSILYANVSVYPRVHIGRNVIVHSGAVIGADGFGYFPQADGSYRKIPQIGRVIIGDAVEIGANTCIDRATMGDTIIETGVKLDNLVQVGHNTVVGAHSVLAGQVGLAGSVRLGRHVQMGGQSGVRDHCSVGDRVAIGAQAGVLSDVAPAEKVMGTPAIESMAFKRRHFYSLRLGELLQHVKRLERRLEQLERQESTS
jgi:UDP-3-O-[3-hydroxymyristoyl] glucosamine N-acyltransferase